MKRLTQILVALAISAVAFSGCDSVVNLEKKPEFTIGFSQCTDDRWRQVMMIQMQTEATKYPELNLIIENAHNDTQTQIDQIHKLTDRKVDLLIISPNESEPITDIAVDAYEKGIPTIIWDRKIESDKYTTFISADNYAIGRDVGNYILNHLPHGSSILEICGLKSSSPAQERHQGFIDVVNGDYRIKQLYGNWDPSVAKTRVEDLRNYSDIDLVFGHNDDMAIAAYEAVAQRDTAAARRIEFIGIDAIVGVDAIIDGRLEASFLYPPGGEFVIETAMDILRGEKVEKNYTLKSYLVDKSNAGTLKSQSDLILNYQNQITGQRKEIDAMSGSFKALRLSIMIAVILLLILALIIIYSLKVNRKMNAANRNLSEKNKEIEERTSRLITRNAKIEDETDRKLQFFTNISHEIRTPLTLILNPLDNLSAREKDPDLQRDIWITQRNAKRLLKIVNELLDFRKVENNKMTLHIKEVDIVDFTREVLNYFEAYAESEKIIYKFQSDAPSINLWIDVDKMEKVLMNLISNAFKNSKKYGDILVTISETPESALISVHDNGIGIELQEQQHIFDRFYSVPSGTQTGTGIGLHLTKEFVEMLNGKIAVDSMPGKFTTFTVELPKGREHLPKDAVIETGDTKLQKDIVLEGDNVNALLGTKYDDTVLVAEDDEDILHYLSSALSENFNVITARNGYEATKAVLENDVSIVLSDVLMPQINGFQLCHNIKKNLATSHIPVILLTALSEDNQRIYGIAEGADEYICKPFNIDYVRIKIISILKDREQVKQAFAQKLNADTILNVKVKDIPCADDIFRDKLFEILENTFEDNEVSIEQISGQLCMSRVHFFRKTKMLFGMNPTDLLRNYRLNKSAILLKDKKLSISETAYSCGYSSPNYFARCFKAKFGETPTEYTTDKTMNTNNQITTKKN